MTRRVPTVELGVAQGDRSELHQHPHPPVFLACVSVEVLEQRQHAVRSPEVGDGALVLGGASIDSSFEQGEEQIGLALELRVHDTLREAGFLGDRFEGCACIPLGDEDPLGGGEHRSPVRLDLLRSTLSLSHTVGI